MSDKKTAKIVGKAQKSLASATPGMVLTLPLAVIRPNPGQPREYFDEVELRATSNSMVGQPDIENPAHIVIRKDKKGEYFAFLVDGERRLKAAKMAGLRTMSCFVRPSMDDDEIFEKSFLMNGCRQNMTPLEYARGISRIIKTRGLNQSQVAKKMGLSQPTISNFLKLLKLRSNLRGQVGQKKLDTSLGLEISHYLQAHQGPLLVGVRKEIAQRGGKVNPKDLSRIVKGVAEKMGFPRRKPKGKSPDKILGHAQLVLRRTLQIDDEFTRILKELAEIPVDKLKGEGVHVLDLLDAFRKTQDLLRQEIRRFSEVE